MKNMDKKYAQDIEINVKNLDKAIEILQYFYECNQNVYIVFNKKKLYSCDAEKETFIDDCYIKLTGLTKQQREDYIAEIKNVNPALISLDKLQETMQAIEDKYMIIAEKNKEKEISIED